MAKTPALTLSLFQDRYTDEPIPANTVNVNAAYFNLQDVKDLVNALDPANAMFVKVFLVLESDPNAPGQKRVTMAMTGGSPTGAKVFAELDATNPTLEGLLADQPCPPNCHKSITNYRYVTGA